LNWLLNVTPVNAAEAWADFERSDFGTAPTLRLRPLEFEPDLVRRHLYDLEIENVTDPALHRLFRTKRDEIARQITALEDRDTARFLYGSLQLYGGIAQPLVSAAEELLETIPEQGASTGSVTAGAFAEAARAEFDRYRAVYRDFPSHIEVRDDISELMVSFGRLLIPEAATFRAERVEPLLHHEVGTHVVTYQNGARQPLTLLTIRLPGYDETQEGFAVLAEYLTGRLDPRRLCVLAARVVAAAEMLDGAGFLEIFESLQERPWASPLVLGQMLKARGVTVVNDPMSLVRATSKLYLEEFPERIRPRSLVTRDPAAIERFVAEVGYSVVKPLYGAKGRNVFVIEDEGEANLTQMTEAVLQDGYAIVQQFVDGGEDGDARIFLPEGQILEHGGKLAAFRRVPTGNDPRANISAGGRPVPVEIGEVERGIVEAMSKKLVADGMYVVGIDVIGDKVVEINAESPGGMQAVEGLYEIDVCPAVIEALERRTGSKS
jgi:glutathione synthetase